MDGKREGNGCKVGWVQVLACVRVWVGVYCNMPVVYLYGRSVVGRQGRVWMNWEWRVGRLV
jgi:hypothetical protein